MAVDVSGLLYFMPIFSFIFVFVLVSTLLDRYKVLGDDKFINYLMAAIFATAFITASSARTYVETVTPWFVVLVVALFFILAIIGVSQKKVEDIVGKKFVISMVVVVIMIFFFAGIKVFSSVLTPLFFKITDNDRILGGVLIFLVAALMSWIFTKK